MDCISQRFIQANCSALNNLQYTQAELKTLSPTDIAPEMTGPDLKNILEPLRLGVAACVNFETRHKRRDGSTYPISFRLFRSPADSAPVFIAIGNDITHAHAAANALLLSESRYQAIVSNIPGLVFQCVREHDGSLDFHYVSERCEEVLGIKATNLQANPELFLNLVMADDVSNFKDSMKVSMQRQLTWNWQGRIWIEDWQDIKWISIRATPHQLSTGATMWDGVITNITHMKLEEIEVKRSRAQLAELSSHIQQVKEQERTKIAREIHDDLGGNLTAIKMALALLKRRIPEDDQKSIEKTNYIDDLANRTIESVHRIAGDLRPSILDFGIVAAIEWQAQEFERHIGIPCQFSSSKEDISLNLDQATTLFRVFQEALTNISKHAQATLVTVELKQIGRSVILEIADNGKGMEQSDRLKPNSFGLRGMLERVESLRGTLSITAEKHVGSFISIQIPLN
ncbi:MAG: PAS domain-containing sensor histidine kinase [Sulfuriferula sp.]